MHFPSLCLPLLLRQLYCIGVHPTKMTLLHAVHPPAKMAPLHGDGSPAFSLLEATISFTSHTSPGVLLPSLPPLSPPPSMGQAVPSSKNPSPLGGREQKKTAGQRQRLPPVPVTAQLLGTK